MTALGGRICAGNKGSCCCSERSAGEGAAVGMEIPGIVLWFVAEMPPGQPGSSLAACRMGIPRSSSRGVKCIEVMRENTSFLPSQPVLRWEKLP